MGEREDRLDRQSRPLRDIIQRWTREHGLGRSGGWNQKKQCWVFRVYIVESIDVEPMTIHVAEDGSEAHVMYHGESVAKTVRGLYRALSTRYAAPAAPLVV